jgi:hypothetical protein
MTGRLLTQLLTSRKWLLARQCYEAGPAGKIRAGKRRVLTPTPGFAIPHSIQASIDIAAGMAVQNYMNKAMRPEEKPFRYREKFG